MGETGGRHAAPVVEPPPPTLREEVADAVSLRTVLLVIGVLLLELGFIWSYVAAFHSPTPQSVPITVVAPPQAAGPLVAKLNALPGTPLAATPMTDEATARHLVQTAQTSAALVVDPTGKEDRLLVASGGGAAVVTALEEVVGQVEQAQGRQIAVTDIVPLQSGDARGLTGFYLAVGWIVGGYLVASLLGVAKGSRPATPRRAVIRLLALVPYAIASGAGGALLVGPILHALTGHFMALWWLGALVVFGAAAVTMAFQVLFGVIGIGITVLVFVVLGNPSAGGAYQSSLIPAFWRGLTDALPNGAATDGIRRIVYFGGHGMTGHWIVLAAYAVGGTVVSLGAAWLMHRRKMRADGPPGPAAAAEGVLV